MNVINEEKRARNRKEVVEAVWRVMVRDGLDQTSLRAVAHEMGCSTGKLTHHFRNKEDLLKVAIEEISRRIGEEVDKAHKLGDPRQQLEAFAKGFLPINKRSEEAWSVWLQFVGTSLSAPDLSGSQASYYAQARDSARAMFERLHPMLDSDFEARYFLALLDGLGVASFMSSAAYTRKELMRVAIAHIGRVAQTASMAAES